MSEEPLYGGIEAGGTKFVCAIGSGPGKIVSEARIETTTPDKTLQQVAEFFRPAAADGRISKLGIGCFGPLDLDPYSPTYGFITATTKPHWSQTDVAGRLARELGVKVAIDTDVDAAALGEFTWGAGQGCDPMLYITIGTGIGGGVMVDGTPLKGLVHTEMGHIRIPHDRSADPFEGACPFHGDCFEGLASGPAIGRRFGRPGAEIPDEDPYWELEARYIALAVQSFIVTLSPRKVVLGGGIMQRGYLFPLIREKVHALLNGYVRHEMLLGHMEQYIVPPSLGNQSGVLGAIALARSIS